MRFRVSLVLVLVLVACGGDDAPPATDSGVGDAGCMSDTDCDDGLFCSGAETCTAGACSSAATSPCAAMQTCDEDADACLTECDVSGDADGDGFDAPECGGDDCDDSDAMRFPGNMEVCDALDRDEDCDPVTFGFRDADGDGFADARCCNGTTCGDDCEDMRPQVHPTAPETCDMLDNDCDSTVDESIGGLWYVDMDGDGYGDDSMMPTMVCAAGMGLSARPGDCDDTEPTIHADARELCDTIDNDCDMSVDEIHPPGPMAECPGVHCDTFAGPTTFGPRMGPTVGGYRFQGERGDTDTVRDCETMMGRVAGWLFCAAGGPGLQLCLDRGTNTIVRAADGASIQVTLSAAPRRQDIVFGPISVTPL